jgi:prophage antirepressor-like protein
MEVVKAFNSNNLHTEIIIKGTYELPLFRANDIGEILEITTIRSTIRDFDETEKVVHSMDTLGGTQQVSFLTEKGLYKVLFKSRKPIAEKFQNWVCEVIKELRLKGSYELKQQLEQAKNEIIKIEETNKTEFNEKVAKEREQILLKEFGYCGSLVYIIKVKSFENGQYIIKIGESRIGVQNRYNEHKTKYGDILLLDCFSVKRSKDFENYLHNHENIKSNRVSDLEGHENERELFLIGNNLSYNTVLKIINKNTKNYNDCTETEIEKLKIENETLKNMISSKNTPQNIVENSNILFQLQNKIENLEKTNKEILSKFENLEKAILKIPEKINGTQIKTATNFNQTLVTLGPRLQQINPETMTISRVYESVADCIKQYNFKLKRPTIDKAVKENTIYYGSRWMYVDRNQDPTIIIDLNPTKQTKQQNLGYIAKLNSNKTEILNIYLDRKTAAISNHYPSSSSLDNPVKNNTLTNGHYYVLYDDCDENIKERFENKIGGEPILYKDGVGQYDENHNLVNEFICKYDCIKQLKMSDKTLNKALNKDIVYNNFYFKTLGSKLCLPY